MKITHRPQHRKRYAHKAVMALKDSINQLVELKYEIERYKAGNKKRVFNENDSWLYNEIEQIISEFPRNKLECLESVIKND